MVARLRSVLRNQTLRLLFNTASLSFLVFFAVYTSSFQAWLLFVFVAMYLYFKPAINIGGYLPELIGVTAALYILPDRLLPQELSVVSVAVGSAIALSIALKNVALVKREGARYWLELGIVSVFYYILFYGELGMFAALVAFAFSLWLLKPMLGAQHALITSFVMFQVNTLLLYAPVTLFAKLTFAVVCLYLLTRALKSAWNRRFAYKALAIAGLATIALLVSRIDVL